MRLSLIYNTDAGSAERIQLFLRHLTSRHRCDLRPICEPGDASRHTREAVSEGVDRIVIAGGDGTINLVVNALAPEFGSPELAVLPLGTGNDLARSLGFVPEAFDAACEASLESPSTLVDVIRISSKDRTTYAINAANGGLGGQVTLNVRTEDKQRWGPLAYWMQAASRLVDLQTYDVHLTLDEHTEHVKALGVAIANGRFVGGGFPIAPRAHINDGLLDVTIVPTLPRLELIPAGLSFVLGRNGRDERIRGVRAKRVELRAEPTMPFSIDGEPTHTLDARFEVLPGALRFVIADDAPGLVGSPSSGQSLE